MIAEFAAGIAGLKTITELTSLVLKMNVDAAVRQKAEESNFAIINAQNLMIELQSKHQELLGEKDQLKKRLVEMENWEVESQKYTLTEFGFRAFVYTAKTNENDPTPKHWLCSECYQNRKKSILQRMGHDTKGALYLCHHCKSELHVMGE